MMTSFRSGGLGFGGKRKKGKDMFPPDGSPANTATSMLGESPSGSDVGSGMQNVSTLSEHPVTGNVLNGELSGAESGRHTCTKSNRALNSWRTSYPYTCVYLCPGLFQNEVRYLEDHKSPRNLKKRRKK